MKTLYYPLFDIVFATNAIMESYESAGYEETLAQMHSLLEDAQQSLQQTLVEIIEEHTRSVS